MLVVMSKGMGNPHGFEGMGIKGTGVGGKSLTLAKPTPLQAGGGF